MKNIKFRMVAFTGAAGKYDPSAPMVGNEDNFYVDDNLSDDIPSHFEIDKVIDLADYGLIMAVADGMGGQNAGEIASGIAVKTVQDFFEPGKLNDRIVETEETRRKYLEKLVVEADRRVKEDAKDNPEHEGMGSTIILAWIVGEKLTLTWCGDSRAYRYNPHSSIGIELLSEDHSYVQELVKKNVITYEDTFDHPQGNIVTRSLGESGRVAQPETRQYEIFENDIILLCSDGLSGVLRDKKTKDHDGNYYPGENIEDLIKNNIASMKQCKDALWDAAERSDWYDNVTIILCQILEGGKPVTLDSQDSLKSGEKQIQEDYRSKFKKFLNRSLHIKTTPRTIVYATIILVSVLLLIAALKSFIPWGHLNLGRSKIPANDSIETALSETIDKPIVDLEFSVKDELLKSLQKGCSSFMQLCNIANIDEDEYFKDIVDEINKFSSINDTTAIKELKNHTNEFIELTERRAENIKQVDKALEKFNNNRQVRSQLEDLREKCKSEDIPTATISDKISRIEPRQNPSNAPCGEAPAVEPSNIIEGELTLIGDDPITYNITISNWEDFLRQINGYKQLHSSTHTLKGVYVDDVLVYDNTGVKNSKLLKAKTNNEDTIFRVEFVKR